MTLSAPKVADLFGDASPREAAERMEEFTGSLNKSLSNPSTVPGQAPAPDATAQLEALVSNKSLSPDVAAGLQNALATQRLAMQDIQKDITLTSPLSTSFAAFDLEAPAKMLTPRPTPYATMLMEERMMLMARGTASGYSGALTAPTFTLASPVAGAGQTALANTTYYVNVTADAGISGNGFGESILGTEASTAVAAGDVLTVTVATPVVGALGYNIYVGTATGAANLKYQGTLKGTGTFTIQGAGAQGLSGNNAAFTTTGAAASRATADTSAYATGYDGILATVLGPNSGYNNAINSTFSTSNPGAEFQTAFASMYANVKADPDMVLLNGNDRKQLSDAIKSGSTANYRLVINNPGTDGTTYGSIVTGLQNEVTGKAVDLMVHPWLNQGVAPILSFTLPIPDTEVSDVWANYLVQDYMGIQWPVTQFEYEFSTYFRGTFFCSAPAWNGAVSGIVNA